MGSRPLGTSLPGNAGDQSSDAWTRPRRDCGLAVLALLAGGCSSGGGFFGPPGGPPAADAASSPTGGTGDRIANFFSGSSAKGPQAVANAQADVNCPRVEVRQGASTLTIGPTATPKRRCRSNIRAHSCAQARDCAVVDGNMVMKIGIEGRVIVGPAGGPGQVDVPLRIAVVQETPGGTRPITTRFIRVPVVIGPSDGNVIFSHVEEGLSFPLPTPTTLLYDYIAYIGFDPLSGPGAGQPKAQAETEAKTKAEAPGQTGRQRQLTATDRSLPRAYCG